MWSREPQANWIARLFYGGVQGFATYWHGYEVHGLENLRARGDGRGGGGTLLVGYHSRPMIDGVYATAFLQAKAILSPVFFALPGARYIFGSFHCESARSNIKGDSADESFVKTVMTADRPVLLFPGGPHECFKPLSEKHIVKWKERPGYARALVSHEVTARVHSATTTAATSVQVIPFYTHNCEEIYPTTDWWYDYSGQMLRSNFHELRKGKSYLLPLMVPKCFLAFGFIIFPRPVKLDLYIGVPLQPLENETDIAFAERVRVAMQELIDNVRKKHKNAATVWTTGNAGVKTICFCAYTVFTNTWLIGTVLLLNMVIVPAVVVLNFIISLIWESNKKKYE
jgi:hypothetical protein